jgi:hypothetical protein
MPTVLSAEGFTTVATEGLGRRSSGTAGSMAYFRGGIFVGTSCAHPVVAGDAPRIVRYDVKSSTWSTVYESPLIDAHARSYVRDRQFAQYPEAALRPSRGRRGAPDEKVPRDSGYRSMCVFQGKSDRTPALYVSTMSRDGAILLRSPDGKSFEQVSEPGFGDPSVYSFCALTKLNGWLFACPAGTVTSTYLDRNSPPQPMVYVSDDPLKGKWLEAAKSGLGDRSNLAICALHPAFDSLYAGTANADLGCQVWKTEARGEPPFEWSPLVADGGGAFNGAFSVCAMNDFNGALYVGVGIPGFGFDTVHAVGPDSGELWRIYPDGRWDLISGQMRFSPQGLKVPLSLLGPGLGDFYNSMVRSLAVHDGVLYLGTYQWEACRCLQIESSNVVGGYQLWATMDGEQWTRVLDDGNGNPTDFGVAAMLSTPHGLFVGTNNQSILLDKFRPRLTREFDFEAGFKVLRGTKAGAHHTR